MDVTAIVQILSLTWNLIYQFLSVVFTLIQNPISAIIGGIILAFIPRYILWAVGLALVVYGVLALIAPMIHLPI
ncbi:hypothetical protein TTSV1_gp18 [Thermoproteus tenax spherical virus 1]|uniref:Uncharacterized protein n=1 Tax=Thermoproteus tenax spherical virus 1 TaxID=292639 RepID=Q647E4_9VIRU|nr:hypothetical protein TTSV1_gp18 [Thermoproteus tenax spherical virus 1]AAU25968.1 hypothetical protein [Thermoproteus tenax spherical virus 1]